MFVFESLNAIIHEHYKRMADHMDSIPSYHTPKDIGIINFERLSPNFIADTMNWFLNSVLD